MGLASELCQIVGDELFFTLHIFLKVGKTQDLSSRILQTLGDALTKPNKPHSSHKIEIRISPAFCQNLLSKSCVLPTSKKI
jgi:hypothetical protein